MKELQEIKIMSEMIELMKIHNYDKKKIDELTNLVTQKIEKYNDKKNMIKTI
jgi:CheY-specific phosphatase CheX